MKKFASILLALATLCACSEDRSQILKVYNWSTYMDESLIPEFEQWYEEQTGEKVHVIYQTFDVLETMLSKIEKGHEDYDVVCPSDYIIEKMMQEDLILPLYKDFGQTPDYRKNISPFITGYFDKMIGNGKNANDYSAGYMWGTTGILYNSAYVTDQEASTWEILRNPKFAGQIYMKDSPRDVCSQIILHLNSERIANGQVDADSLMRTPDVKVLSEAEAWLEGAKPYIAGWEADFGKEQMIKERAMVNLNWSGDSEWAIEEGAEIGLDLRYTCPKEGFTIFFDGWVIPKYAQNVKAANYFINFLCRQDVAIRNSAEIGYVSVCGGDEIMAYYQDEKFDPIDVSYFFGPDATAVKINPVKYPDISDINRSAMEHDWGKDTHLLIETWARLKGSNADSMTVIVIAAVIVAILALAAVSQYKRFKNKKTGKRKTRHVCPVKVPDGYIKFNN